MKKLNVLLLVIFGLLFNAKTNAQTTVLSSGMSIQGIARDNSNQALANMDQLNMIFTVYYYIGASTTPTVIQERTATIKTDNFGVFSYVFVIDQAQFNLISTNSAYLKVSSSGVVFSDEKLQTVPYAIYAQNGVPTGSIMPFIGTVAPNGWLLCDGSTIISPYGDNLKALLGSGVTTTPDLRGLFLRGTGTAASASSRVGPALKTVQQDDIVTHRHDLGSSAVISYSGNHNHGNGEYNQLLKVNGTATARDTDNSAIEPNLYITGTMQDAGNHNHTISGSTNYTGGSSETRPINYGVNYIIKL